MRISDWSSDVCSSDLLAPIFISNDRPARCLDLALALQAIKGLQRLYGVARFGSDERAAHDRIEVDKAAFAHEAVEKGLADTIPRGGTPPRGALIGCIMIDEGLRKSRESSPKKSKTTFERFR